jgi:hypothetical protein
MPGIRIFIFRFRFSLWAAQRRFFAVRDRRDRGRGSSLRSPLLEASRIRPRPHSRALRRCTATRQASQKGGTTEGQPKPYCLRCKQQCEQQGVLPRQFDGHEFNCTAPADCEMFRHPCAMLLLYGSSNYQLSAPYFLVNHAVSRTVRGLNRCTILLIGAGSGHIPLFQGHYGNQRSPVQV